MKTIVKLSMVVSFLSVYLVAEEIPTTKEVAALVKVVQSAEYGFQYYIQTVEPINHICDIDLMTRAGRKLATAIVMQCVELSKVHSNADFSLQISCRNGRMTIKVIVYSCSMPLTTAHCDFCDRKKFSGDIIHENNTTIAFEKSRPARTPINFLIVPKRHVVNYKDKNFRPDIFINQLAMAQELSRRLTDTRVELYVNNGSNAAQSVFHSHMYFYSPAQWKE